MFFYSNPWRVKVCFRNFHYSDWKMENKKKWIELRSFFFNSSLDSSVVVYFISMNWKGCTAIWKLSMAAEWKILTLCVRGWEWGDGTKGLFQFKGCDDAGLRVNLLPFSAVINFMNSIRWFGVRVNKVVQTMNGKMLKYPQILRIEWNFSFCYQSVTVLYLFVWALR